MVNEYKQMVENTFSNIYPIMGTCKYNIINLKQGHKFSCDARCQHKQGPVYWLLLLPTGRQPAITKVQASNGLVRHRLWRRLYIRWFSRHSNKLKPTSLAELPSRETSGRNKKQMGKLQRNYFTAHSLQTIYKYNKIQTKWTCGRRNGRGTVWF